MPTKKMRAPAEAVAMAAALKPRLEAAADRLNEKIAEFERTLKSLKLGVSAKVEFSTDIHGEDGEDLLFTKWADDWHLVIRSWDAHGPPDSDRYELLKNKSREQRLEAVELFPRLLDALIEAAEVELDRVSTSADSVDALIAALKSGAKS